jgi:carbon starvation protein
MGVFVASFAGTTLDTATRIQRYVISELFGGFGIKALVNRYVATAVAVGSALILAFATGAGGKGALTLWPLFGAVNQTLAALALIIITIYLKKRGGLKWLISGLPAIFMAVMTIWAVVLNQVKFGAGDKMLLTIINLCILVIALWIAIEGVIKFFTTTAKEEPPSAATEAA